MSVRLDRDAWPMVKRQRQATNEYPPHTSRAVMLDGEISKHVDILRGVAQGCTSSPNIFIMYINDLIVAVEAAKQEVTVRENTMSGLKFADYQKHPNDCRNK